MPARSQTHTHSNKATRTHTIFDSLGRGGNFDTDHYEKFHQHVIAQYDKDCKRDNGRLERLRDQVGVATAVRCFENVRNGVRLSWCHLGPLVECTLWHARYVLGTFLGPE